MLHPKHLTRAPVTLSCTEGGGSPSTGGPPPRSLDWGDDPPLAEDHLVVRVRADGASGRAEERHAEASGGDLQVAARCGRGGGLTIRQRRGMGPQMRAPRTRRPTHSRIVILSTLRTRAAAA